MRKGQAIVEYSVILAIILAALLAMQGYIKRGMQGGYRQSVDQMGEQYAPGDTTSDMTTTVVSDESSETITIQDGDKLKSSTTFTTSDTTAVSGWEQVGS